MARKREVVKEKLEREVSLPHKIAVDTLGILLIIAAGLFGWLPGPGGVPLLLAGLGLLATNHEWARKLLHSLKENGNKVIEVVFRDHPLLVITYDILAVTLLIVAGLVFGQASGNIWRGLATALAFLGVGLFLGNRKRIYALNRFVSRVIRRSKP